MATNNTRKVPKFLQKAYAAVQKNLGYGNVTANNLKKMKTERNAVYAAEQAAANAAKAAAAATEAAKATVQVVNEVKKCGKKPSAWVVKPSGGTERNPALGKWEGCVKNGGLTGGRRKTQKRKTQKRR